MEIQVLATAAPGPGNVRVLDERWRESEGRMEEGGFQETLRNRRLWGEAKILSLP